MPVSTIRDNNHLASELSLAGAKLSVLDFTAKWCGPCKNISPELDRLSDKYTTTNFFKVDVDDCSEVAQEYNVRSMPTFVFIKSSKEVGRFSGADAALLEATIVRHASATTFTGSGYTLNSSANSSTTTSSASGGWLGNFMSSVIGSNTNPSTASPTVNEDEVMSMNQNYEQQAREIFPIDNNNPTCKIQVRLLDGKKLNVIMNNTQSVEHLRHYITIARPAYAETPFVLFTGHPTKVIEDELITLNQANLANAVVLLQLKK